MKEQAYSLEDEEFFTGLKMVTERFRENGVDLVLLGGVATQAHIVDILSDHGNRSIAELVAEKTLSRELMRKTDDFDLGCLCGNEKIDNAVRSLHGYSMDISPDHAYHIDVTRHGTKRPKIEVTTYGDRVSIRLNFSTEPRDLERLNQEFYHLFIEQAKSITIKHHNGAVLETRAIKPEYLVAAKLTRNAPKDLFDIHALLDTMGKKGMKFNYGELKTVLGIKCTNAPRCTDTECFEIFPYSAFYESFLAQRKIRE